MIWVTSLGDRHYSELSALRPSLWVEGVTEMVNSNTYLVTATWKGGRRGEVAAEDIRPPIHFSTPPGFKGDLGYWTPEHLLLASVASCYVATFYALAESKLGFLGLEILVEGTLGKPDGRLQFTNIVLKPTVNIARPEDGELANRLLARAHEGCLIARSLACPVHLEPLVRPAEEVLTP